MADEPQDPKEPTPVEEPTDEGGEEKSEQARVGISS